MEWLNILIQGSLLGGIYALFAIGLSMSFGIMRLVNIAHGDFIVLSAYVALVVTQNTGIDPISSLVIVVPVMFVVGYAIQRGLLNHTLSGGLLPGKLRLGLRVLLGLLRLVTLLSSRLCARCSLRSLLSQHPGLVLCTLDQPAEGFRLLAELRHLALQATDRA